MKKKTIILHALMAFVPLCAGAQRMLQHMERSVVAVTDNAKEQVLVTWRKLAADSDSCRYNIYKRTPGSADYVRVNAEPVIATNWQTTRSVIPYNSEIAVTTVVGGVESKKSMPFLFAKKQYKDVFFEFDFENKVLLPDNYRCKYAWPMDLDGNGRFDAVLVDRLYAGGSAGVPDPGCSTQSHKLQAYTLDGKCLWTVDMGMNVAISAGQNDMVLAYDINCDGKCEVIVRGSDGMRFWDAEQNKWGQYIKGAPDGDTDGDGIVNYRSDKTHNPPYYITIIDGKTGAEIESAELDYSKIADGSDSYSRNNRADYMNDGDGTEYAFLGGKFAICYFDGIHPSLAVQCYNRTIGGTHHYYFLEWKYDWQGGRPFNFHHSYTWPFRSSTPYVAEFHQVRVADVDGDGTDELMEGGYAVNPVKGLVTHPHIGHGDRFDVGDLNPERPGLEVYAIQQSNLLGQLIYDAATGDHIKEWYLPKTGDVGRGRCMDVDPAHKGYEVFSTMPNLYDCNGRVISEADTPFPVEGAWWDADLQRELIASPGGSGYSTNVNIHKYDGTRLIEFSKQSNWTVHAGTGVRPAFMGDMTGDWREELILMKQKAETSTGLVGYSTDIPTDYSITALMQDPHYRGDCNTRGYYQMPCTSFYLGGDMPLPPLPPVVTADLRWKDGTQWTEGSGGFTDFGQTAEKAFANGKSVIFDISGNNTLPVNITGSVSPAAVYIMNPKNHDYTFGGTGTLAGNMQLWKSLQGKATFNVGLVFDGTAVIAEGILCANAAVDCKVDLRARGTLAGTPVIKGDIIFEGALNYEGCRLMPGSDIDPYGTMTVDHDLVLPGNVYVELKAGDMKAAKLLVRGNLDFIGTNTFSVCNNNGTMKPGRYVLAECTGKLNASDGSIAVRGLDGVNYNLDIEDKAVVLVVNDTRKAQDNVVWTGCDTNRWNYKDSNFSVDGNGTAFVTGDGLVFDDRSANRNISVDGNVVPGNMLFDFNNGTYTLNGTGSIGGSGSFTKSGRGELVVKLEENTFTGNTFVNGGTLTVATVADGGKASSIGAASTAEGNLQINGAQFKVDALSMATDRMLTVSDTAVINVANAKGSLSLKSMVKGGGVLVKDGPGQLNFTYGGENMFAGMVVKQGRVAQGHWSASFGKIGSPMVLCGGTVALIDMNNMSAQPEFNYRTTVAEGTESTITGTTRGAINGSFCGKGTLAIVSAGVRSDIGADFSGFEGTLIAKGENFRLTDNVTDMGKTNLLLDAGSRVAHYKAGSGNSSAVTTKVGALVSVSEDCVLGNSADKYIVGLNSADTEFAGMLAAADIEKSGTGVLRLTRSGSTANITVVDGLLLVDNPVKTGSLQPLTEGKIVAKDSGRIAGTGCAKTVDVYRGATLGAGTPEACGTLKATGNVTMYSGSTLLCRVGTNAYGGPVNDKFEVAGRFAHSNDTLLVDVWPDRKLSEGTEIRIFTGTGKPAGKCVIKTVSSGRTIVWDDSKLITDGVLRVASVTAIGGLHSDSKAYGEDIVDVTDVSGKIIRRGGKRSEATRGLNAGVYVAGGKKVVVH